MFLPLKHLGLYPIYCSVIHTIFSHKQSQFGINMRVTQFFNNLSSFINFHVMETKGFIEKIVKI